MKSAMRFVGTLVATTLWLPALTLAQGPGHGVHPPMPDQQFYLHCEIKVGPEPTVIQVPLDIPSVMAPAELTQSVELPAPFAALRLKQYLPRAKLQQDVVPDERPTAKPALLLSVDGPRQNYQLWLIADDFARNRLTSLIGTWRYMAVANKEQRDELFRQFENELTRPPTLHIGRTDRDDWRAVPAEVGALQKLDDLGCTLRVQAFYPDFTFDKETGKPLNQSDARRNPAALVEIERDGTKEERWIFAKFPKFEAEPGQTLPYRITLDCPLDIKRKTPDFVLVTVDRSAHEVWARHGDKVTAARVALDERTDVPGSPYTFHLAKFVPAGRLVEKYDAAETRGAVPALQLETELAPGRRETVWLEKGKPRVLTTAQGQVVVSFGPPRPTAPPAHQPKP